MNADNKDFFDHPHRRHWITPRNFLAGAFVASMLVAAVWAESYVSATYYAEQEAARQMGSTRP